MPDNLIPTTPIIPAGALTQAFAGQERRRVDPYQSTKEYGEALMAQMAADCAKAREVLGQAESGEIKL